MKLCLAILTCAAFASAADVTTYVDHDKAAAALAKGGSLASGSD